jgi:thiamine-monophosphate kinase
MTVGDLTERELVARIQQRLPPPPGWMLVGIGDDAAVVEPERNRVEVLTVDAIVDGVHFDREFVPPDAIGHRALAVNLSDLAAMGAAPRLALLSMALPADLATADFDAIADGLCALATRHRVHVAGGNLTRTPGPLTIDVTAIGTVKRRQALTRAGARPGDEVYVSGTVGAAAAGLKVISHQSSVVSPSHEAHDRVPSDDTRLTTAFLFPVPRVRLGILLSRNRAATACIDLSDGLADGVHQIACASGVGMTIDADAIPFEGDLTSAITGGDDYELLFTVRPRTRLRLRTVMRHAGVPLTRIGVCTEPRDVVLARAGALEPMPAGFSHFR